MSAQGRDAARTHRLAKRMIWIQVTLFTVASTALVWGAFAQIGWLFWVVGLPVVVVALVYTFISVGFLQLWAEEARRGR